MKLVIIVFVLSIFFTLPIYSQNTNNEFDETGRELSNILSNTNIYNIGITIFENQNNQQTVFGNYVSNLISSSISSYLSNKGYKIYYLTDGNQNSYCNNYYANNKNNNYIKDLGILIVGNIINLGNTFNINIKVLNKKQNCAIIESYTLEHYIFNYKYVEMHNEIKNQNNITIDYNQNYYPNNQLNYNSTNFPLNYNSGNTNQISKSQYRWNEAKQIVSPLILDNALPILNNFFQNDNINNHQNLNHSNTYPWMGGSQNIKPSINGWGPTNDNQGWGPTNNQYQIPIPTDGIPTQNYNKMIIQ